MSKKFEKNYEKSRRKMLREEHEQQHPHHTEGLWEEINLELSTCSSCVVTCTH